MKRFFGTSKGKEEKGSKTGAQATGGTRGPGATSSGKPAAKPNQKKFGEESKPKKQVQKPASARNAQSALQPGNNSGFAKQKEHPMVQFGPILKEFLASKELVDQGISVKYDKGQDQTVIAVSFKKVQPNGVSTSEALELSIEEYLAQRKGLLKVKDDSSHYTAFVAKLLDRLGVDITRAKPSVSFKSVESFVLKHLSPVERTILSLSEDEYSRLDTRKIPEILTPSLALIERAYGGVQKRSETMVKLINTTGPVTDVEPPNWALGGVTGYSKGVLMDTLKIRHQPNISDEQRATIEALATSLLGSDSPGHGAPLESEDSKRDDDPL